MALDDGGDMLTGLQDRDIRLEIIARTDPAGSPFDIAQIVEELAAVDSEVRANYAERNGVTMDTYRLIDREAVLAAYHSHPVFRRVATELLGLDEFLIPELTVPWFNEPTAAFISQNDAKDLITAVESHPFYSQLLKGGHPVSDVRVGDDGSFPFIHFGVGGILVTADAKIVLGSRSADVAVVPNSVAYIAGNVVLTPELRSGEHSFYDGLRVHFDNKLNIGDVLADYEPLALIRCDQFGPERTLVYAVKTPLAFDEVQERFAANPHPEKNQHARLVAVDATPNSVASFRQETGDGAALPTHLALRSFERGYEAIKEFLAE